METFGNTSLLERKKIGYFASNKIASLSVLPTLDWACEIAKQKDIAIVSGFRSPLEKEVLKFLLRGNCGIIIMLSRSIYKVVPQELRPYFDAGRLLFIAEEKVSATRPSRQLCQRANARAAEIADSLVFASLPYNSSLGDIFSRWNNRKPITIIIPQQQ